MFLHSFLSCSLLCRLHFQSNATTKQREEDEKYQRNKKKHKNKTGLEIVLLQFLHLCDARCGRWQRQTDRQRHSYFRIIHQAAVVALSFSLTLLLHLHFVTKTDTLSLIVFLMFFFFYSMLISGQNVVAVAPSRKMRIDGLFLESFNRQKYPLVQLLVSRFIFWIIFSLRFVSSVSVMSAFVCEFTFTAIEQVDFVSLLFALFLSLILFPFGNVLSLLCVLCHKWRFDRIANKTERWNGLSWSIKTK